MTRITAYPASRKGLRSNTQTRSSALQHHDKACRNAGSLPQRNPALPKGTVNFSCLRLDSEKGAAFRPRRNKHKHTHTHKTELMRQPHKENQQTRKQHRCNQTYMHKITTRMCIEQHNTEPVYVYHIYIYIYIYLFI